MSARDATPETCQAYANSAPLPSPPPVSSAVPAKPCDWGDLSDAVLVQPAQAGDSTAAEILLRRHLARFQQHAEKVCADSTEAEDLCHEACLKALANLPKLRNGNAFCAWVLAFITNEARNWNGKGKKVGTSLEELTLKELESMSVSAPDHSAADQKDLEDLLRRQTRRIEGPCRQTAAFMLDYYAREQRLPPVRTIADVLHTSQGTAQRCRESALRVWRRTLAAFDLFP
jgi:RNA polymerase sigma factor (sigma-70 family)